MVKVGLKAFLKTFPTKMKPTKCPERKKRGGEKAKSKSQDCCVIFKPKNKKQQGTPNIMMLVLIIHRGTWETLRKRIEVEQQAFKYIPQHANLRAHSIVRIQ